MILIGQWLSAVQAIEDLRELLVRCVLDNDDWNSRILEDVLLKQRHLGELVGPDLELVVEEAVDSLHAVASVVDLEPLTTALEFLVENDAADREVQADRVHQTDLLIALLPGPFALTGWDVDYTVVAAARLLIWRVVRVGDLAKCPFCVFRRMLHAVGVREEGRNVRHDERKKGKVWLVRITESYCAGTIQLRRSNGLQFFSISPMCYIA